MPVKWQSPFDVTCLTPKLADWLLNTGSLTERLQALTTHFSVAVLGQEVLDMDISEKRLLSTQCNQKWQIREVLLQGRRANSEDLESQKNWVFARSVLPHELCTSQWANLGNQPLGKRIFNDNNFVRSEFEIGQLFYHPLTQQAFAQDQACWARRSKFTIAQYELIVAEAFLPDSPCYW